MTISIKIKLIKTIFLLPTCAISKWKVIKKKFLNLLLTLYAVYIQNKSFETNIKLCVLQPTATNNTKTF